MLNCWKNKSLDEPNLLSMISLFLKVLKGYENVRHLLCIINGIYNILLFKCITQINELIHKLMLKTIFKRKKSARTSLFFVNAFYGKRKIFIHF